MAFKAKLKEAELTEELKFPKLMRGTESGNIVLFEAPGEGVLLVDKAKNPKHPEGKRFKNYSMSLFMDFYGEVTLKNK